MTQIYQTFAELRYFAIRSLNIASCVIGMVEKSMQLRSSRTGRYVN